MGFYIETPGNQAKAGQLVEDFGAVQISAPAQLNDVPSGKTLVCVVENPFFDAAAIIYDEQELTAFADPSDGRRRTWLLLDTKVAASMNDQFAAILQRLGPTR